MSMVRRKRNLIYCLLALICIILIVVLVVSDRKSIFAFSKEAGFYDSDFYLKIYKPFGSKVYYTLDGSVPTDKSTEYTDPILITDASNNNNIYANTTDDTMFLREQGANKQGYCLPAVPDENIDKCTVVRAICVRDDENETIYDEIVSSYFVGYNLKKGYDDIKVLSLVSDPEGLFGYENGINCLGASFDGNDFESDTEWVYLAANYKNKGREWERETYLQLFDEEKKIALSQKCGMRVHGRMSRNGNCKSYNLYARKEYDGNSNFNYDFWNTGYYPDTFTLYGCGQDTRSMIRDRIACELSDDLSLTKCHYTPCVIFLDGEYWGFRYICEKIDEQYFEHYYGVDRNDILEIKFENEDPVELGSISLDSQKMKDYVSCMMGKRNLSATVELIDKNFDREYVTDYFALMIYLARGSDWPSANMAIWSSISNGSGYSDGRWRPILYDVYATSMDYAQHNQLEWILKGQPYFEILWEDESFRKDLYERIDYIDKICFSDERVDGYLDKYIEEYSKAVEKHLARFYGDNITMDDFYKEIETVRQFFHTRHEFFEENRNLFE